MNSSSAGQLSKRSRTPSSPNILEVLPSSKRHKPVCNTTVPLCADCEMLDLDASWDKSYKHYERAKGSAKALTSRVHEAHDGTHFYDDAILVHQFGTRLSEPSNCSLCQFFRTLRVQPELHKHHKLLAFRSSDSWLFDNERLAEFRTSESLKHYVDTVFMAVVPDLDSIPLSAHEVRWLDYEIPTVGAIFRKPIGESSNAAHQNLLDARELEEKADMVLGKSWLDTCRREHGNACKQRASQEPILRGFRLINCTTDKPVIEEKPWGTPYVALSYVWGSKPEDTVDYPPTVTDAMEVTKKLGMSYLWVDRRCIKQDDNEERKYLVSRMTTIYEAAEFTIVAAAGKGAGHGLPGVQLTPREPQPKYYLDSGSLLISILPDPRREILNSEHWTRGWTYQEGVLSNRRIVFTEYQTYWECRCMASHESVDMTLFHTPATHPDDPNSVLIDFMLTGIFKGGAYSGGSRAHQDDIVIALDEAYRLDYGFPMAQDLTIRAQLRGLTEHIREFSKRNLGRDTDSLVAFQGIVGMYEQTKSLYLFHGIPMWTGAIAGSATGAQATFAFSVSSWYHRTSADHAMFVSEPCERRTHLPSWTWAGWKGTVSWRAPPNLEHCAYMSDLISAVSPSLVWSANIYLSTPDRSCTVRLLGTESATRLASEMLTTMEVKTPFVLSAWSRIEDIHREWSWGNRVGRPGREQIMSHSADRDVRWYRIGGRLSFIGMSISMSASEWTSKHASGELVSVLMFAGRYCDVKHGTARFLTLRKVSTQPERWERIGTLYLIIPFLGNCKNTAGLFNKIPARQRERGFIIQ